MSGDFVTNSYCEFQLRKNVSEIENGSVLCDQIVNLKTYSKTLYYSILKLKCSPSILKRNKG